LIRQFKAIPRYFACLLALLPSAAQAMAPLPVPPASGLPLIYIVDGVDAEPLQLGLLRQFTRSWQQGDWDQAYLFCNTLTNNYPQDRLSWLCLVDVGIHSQQYVDAARAFSELIRRNDLIVKSKSFQFNHGLTRERLGELDQAIAIFKQLLAEDPNDETAWNALAHTLNRANRHHEALAAAQRALNLAPYYAEAWSTTGDAYRGLRQFNRAIHAYETSVHTEPIDARIPRSDFWLPLGETYLEYGQIDLARQALYFLERAGHKGANALKAKIGEREKADWIRRHED
jgi:tetratricopeptide (TPR) repeat protein